MAALNFALFTQFASHLMWCLSSIGYNQVLVSNRKFYFEANMLFHNLDIYVCGMVLML